MKKKSMSLFALPVSTANLIYNISFIALLIGAVMVLASASALIWSSQVRDQDATDRIAALASAEAQAHAAMEKAQADLAESTRQLTQANAARADAEKEAAAVKAEPSKAAQPIAGRTITLDNRELFIDFVKTVSKGKVVVQAITSDPEASRYAHQVADMLQGAGYGVVENYGSAVLLGNAPVGVEMRIQSMEAQPLYAGSLQKGLEFVGIPTSGALDPAAADAVIIFIGSKP